MENRFNRKKRQLDCHRPLNTTSKLYNVYKQPK